MDRFLAVVVSADFCWISGWSGPPGVRARALKESWDSKKVNVLGHFPFLWLRKKEHTAKETREVCFCVSLDIPTLSIKADLGAGEQTTTHVEEMWFHQQCLLETVLGLSYCTKIHWGIAQKRFSWHHPKSQQLWTVTRQYLCLHHGQIHLACNNMTDTPWAGCGQNRIIHHMLRCHQSRQWLCIPAHSAWALLEM